MKKILLLSMIYGLTTLGANASYSVNYNNTGTPTYGVQGGIMQKSINSFGSNAAFTPENRIKAGQKHRQIEYEKKYYEGLSKGNTINVNVNTPPKDNNDDDNKIENSQTNTEEKINTTSKSQTNTTTKNQTSKTKPRIYKKDGVTYYR